MYKTLNVLFLVCSTVSVSQQFSPRGDSKICFNINLEYITARELLQVNLHADKQKVLMLFSLQRKFSRHSRLYCSKEHVMGSAIYQEKELSIR